MPAAPRLVLDARALLAEGPCWDARRARLWWVDILRGDLHQLDPATGQDAFHALGRGIGAAVVEDAGTLLLALEDGFFRLDWDAKSLEPLGDPEAGKPANRFNDGKLGPGGRFFAGTMAKDARGPHGALYRLDPDGAITRLLDGVTISNGLAFSHDGALLYYIDTPTQRVDVMDHDPATGAVANRREAFAIPREMGAPDGMCIDGEGMLWIALWGGGAVARFDPRDGRLLRRVEVPASQATSCCLDGTGRVLFITTASVGLSEARRDREPHAGGLFALDLE